MRYIYNNLIFIATAVKSKGSTLYCKEMNFASVLNNVVLNIMLVKQNFPPHKIRNVIHNKQLIRYIYKKCMYKKHYEIKYFVK